MSKSSKNLEAKRKKRFGGAVGDPNFMRPIGFDWGLWNLISILRHHHRPDIRLLNSKPQHCKRRRRVHFNDLGILRNK